MHDLLLLGMCAVCKHVCADLLVLIEYLVNPAGLVSQLSEWHDSLQVYVAKVYTT